MIPLRDDQPTRTFPLVTLSLIALNVLVYLAQGPLGLDSNWAMVPYEVTHNLDLNNVVAHLAPSGQVTFTPVPPNTLIHLGPRDIFYGLSPHPLWLTVLTGMFMHTGFLHIAGNMLFLWIFGNNIEDALGKFRFLLFYLACGVAAAALQIYANPDSVIPNVGASGAIAGVLGAYLLLYPHARVLTLIPIFGFGFFAHIRAQWVLLAWVAYDVLPAFTSANTLRGGGGVAYFAHLGGFAAGLILILLLGGQSLAAGQRRAGGYRA